jgi:hypothetical protein
VHRRIGIFILTIVCALVGSYAAPPAPAVVQASVQSARGEDIPALLRQLADPASEWTAASRLQKAGPAAIAALVSHLPTDPFRDRDHGNHSPTMRVLEKIGDPAVVQIGRSLTAEVLASGAGTDMGFIESAVLALAQIRTASAVRALLVVVSVSSDAKVQELALNALVQPEFDFHDWRSGRSWENCLRRESPACPFDTEGADVTEAAKPFLEQVRSRLSRQTVSARLAGAQALVLWGDAAQRDAGEQELLKLADDSGNAYFQQYAIRVLGHVGVDAVRPIVKKLPVTSDYDVKRAAAETLARLGDDGYRPLINQLMSKSRESIREGFNEEEFRVKWAIQFAGQSRDITFIPRLVDFLGDPKFASEVLVALRRLTFQDFGEDSKMWREWWAGNRTKSWQSHLTGFIDSVLPRMAAAETWVLNDWMSRLEDADDRSVLPFVRAYFRHPRFDMSHVGPNTFRGGGGTPPGLVLLLNLASQGLNDARQLLYECASRKDYPTAIDCATLVAVFDRQAGVDRLRALRNEPYAYFVAHALVELGDRESIPMLIQQLELAASSIALEDLKRYTQENFDNDIESWRQWWREQGTTFSVKVRAAQVDGECCRK